MINAIMSHFTHFLLMGCINAFAYCYQSVNVIRFSPSQSDHIKRLPLYEKWKTPTLTLYDSDRRALVKVIWRFSANCSSLDIATRPLKLQKYFPSGRSSFRRSAKTTLTTIYQKVKHKRISILFGSFDKYK